MSLKKIQKKQRNDLSKEGVLNKGSFLFHERRILMNKVIGIASFLGGCSFGAGVVIYGVTKVIMKNSKIRKAVADTIYEKVDQAVFGEKKVVYEEG